MNSRGVAMCAPAHDAGDATHEGLADHQVADTSLVVTAAVVDHEHVALLRSGNGLEKDVDAARVPRRTRRSRGLAAGEIAPETERPDTHWKRQLRARID